MTNGESWSRPPCAMTAGRHDDSTLLHHRDGSKQNCREPDEKAVRGTQSINGDANELPAQPRREAIRNRMLLSQILGAAPNDRRSAKDLRKGRLDGVDAAPQTHHVVSHQQHSASALEAAVGKIGTGRHRSPMLAMLLARGADAL